MRAGFPAGTHNLQLARAQLSDSGTYVCEALNAAGRDQRRVQLSVLGMAPWFTAYSVPYPPSWAAQHQGRVGHPVHSSVGQQVEEASRGRNPKGLASSSLYEQGHQSQWP